VDDLGGLAILDITALAVIEYASTYQDSLADRLRTTKGRR